MTDLQVMAAILTGFSALVGALATWTVKSLQAAAKIQASIIVDLRSEIAQLKAEAREDRGRDRLPPSNPRS